MTDIAQRHLTNDPLSAIVLRVVATITLWQRRMRQRGQLARLSDHELRDIGLARPLQYSEVRKHFWQA
jgi:uncharacterized protein YjiS (DUF1127 family)